VSVVAAESVMGSVVRLVDLGWVENAVADNSHIAGRRVELSEEAAAVTLVAGRTTMLCHLDQHCVCIAVVVDRPDFLEIAAFLTLSPQLVAAATVVTDSAGGAGFLPGLLVHVGQHQDFAVIGVLGDDREQVGLGEIRAVHVTRVSQKVRN